MLFWTLAGGLGLVVSFLALQAYFRWIERAERYDKVITKPPVELLELEGKQIEQISGYRWIDPEKGIVGIPIERAMEVVASESRSRN
jgi:hypothetical protein